MTDYDGLLRAVATPRRAGTPSSVRVRELLRRELGVRGFVTMEHAFTGRSLLHRLGRAPLDGVNLIAVRPRARVGIWLVAHYDSKGQPLSMAARLVSAALVVVGGIELAALGLRSVMGSLHIGLLDACLAAAGLIGLVLLAANRVTDRSAGAVDNASGVVTALAIVDALPADAAVGVIFPDAEEYGLVGARALLRERAHLLAGSAVVNLDGIDDRGSTIALVHRGGPLVDRVVAALGARRVPWLPVIVDGAALGRGRRGRPGRGAREAVTIMRGDWGTARIVHTARDTPERLTLDGVRRVAQGLAAALIPG
ncbi:MAG TPA: M28 family peptidase [Gemmatimonadales bacterium]|nr:M28 family peptidase [Gemmatimonadales bacterium]